MPHVLVVVLAGTGTRDLTRTVDSVGRQSGVERDLVIAGPADWEHEPFARAAAQRAGGRFVAVSAGACESVAAIAADSTVPLVAIVPAGWRLTDGCLAACVHRLECADASGAAAPVGRVETADGTRGADLHAASSFVDLIAEPSSVPPVFVMRRPLVGAPDGACRGLYELAVHVALVAGLEVAPDATAVCDAAGPVWRGAPECERLAEYRRVVTRHRAAIEERMAEIITRREIAFARLRDRHRLALAERDEGLARLDEDRAAVAHHRAWLAHHGREAFEWGDFRRTNPVSRDWGYDRGTPVDRPYIEAFLASRSSDIHGAVLEVQEPDFTVRFGGPRVREGVVLDVDNRNGRASLVADLRYAPHVAAASVDSIILTQTLHVIDDMRAALEECARILKSGGVLLATFPSASRVCLEYGSGGDLWRTTPAGARALVETAFGVGNVDCAAYGNVLTNVAFLEGLAASDLTAGEVAATDPYFPAITGVRAVKRDRHGAQRACRGTVLLYHRIAEGPHALNVSPAAFRDQIRWLAGHSSVVPLEDLLSAPEADLPPDAVALTFDDGYVDNLEAAAPLLAEAGLPATFFVTTRWLDEAGEYWWDLLDRVAHDTAALADACRALEPLLPELLVPRREPHGAAQRLHDRLVHASLAERDRILAQLRSLPAGTSARHRPMTADEIGALAAIPGMSLGMHTVNHLALPDQDEDTMRREIGDCQAALARFAGGSIDVLAYPYGAVNEASAGLVRSTFGWGVTCVPASVPASFDAARVPRQQIGDWGVPEFERRIRAWLRGVDAP